MAWDGFWISRHRTWSCAVFALLSVTACSSKLVPFNPFSLRIPLVPDACVVLGGFVATTATRTGPAEHAVRRGCIDREHRGRLEGVPRIENLGSYCAVFCLETSAVVCLVGLHLHHSTRLHNKPPQMIGQAYRSATTEAPSVATRSMCENAIHDVLSLASNDPARVSGVLSLYSVSYVADWRQTRSCHLSDGCMRRAVRSELGQGLGFAESGAGARGRETRWCATYAQWET